MAIFRHTLAQVAEYRELSGINQSALKVLIKDGIQAFVDQRDSLKMQTDLYYEEKRWQIIGTAVDTKLTHTDEEYEQTHFESTLIKKPGPKTMSVIQKAFAMAKESFPLGPDDDFKLYRDQFFIACNEEAYRMRQAQKTEKGVVIYTTKDNDDSRLSSIAKENGGAYWSELIKAEGKQMLSDVEVNLISSIVIAFKTHPFTSWIFKDDPNIDTVYQWPVYFEVEGVDCKGLLDITRIDHPKQKIFPIDEKTLGDYIIKFPRAIDERRYDIQGAFYKEGVVQNLTALSDLIGKDVTKYKVADFAFVAESTVRPGIPLIFPLLPDMMARGRDGGVSKQGYRYPGYVEALTKYKQWQAIDFSLYERFKAKNGIVPIGTDYDMNINI